MNIWIIYLSEDLPIGDKIRKGRTSMLIDALLKRGHRVTWWTTAFDHATKTWIYKENTKHELSENFTIYALKGCRYNSNFSLLRYFDHKIIACEFRKMLPTMSVPDVILGSLPYYDITYEATEYAQKHNLPIVVDIRDLWPELFFHHLPIWFKGIAKILLHSDLKKKSAVVEKATAVVSMMNNILDMELKKVSRPRSDLDRVFYLGAKQSRPRTIEKYEGLAKNIIDEKKFVVTFVGAFGLYYHPITLIKAAINIKEKNIIFLVGGDGKYFDDVKNAAADLDNVFFTGWLSNDEMVYILSLSHVGVITCNHATTAFPNKAFAYFAAGLPIISSLNGELRDILCSGNMGLYYKPGDDVGLAERILQLYHQPVLLSSMRDKVREAYHRLFDAEEIYMAYAEHIENIAKSNYR